MIMTFEDLDAWKKARELVNAVYLITRETALRNDFGLCGQNSKSRRFRDVQYRRRF